MPGTGCPISRVFCEKACPERSRRVGIFSPQKKPRPATSSVSVEPASAKLPTPRDTSHTSTASSGSLCRPPAPHPKRKNPLRPPVGRGSNKPSRLQLNAFTRRNRSQENSANPRSPYTHESRPYKSRHPRRRRIGEVRVCHSDARAKRGRRNLLFARSGRTAVESQAIA